jgi:antagonist of KipI
MKAFRVIKPGLFTTIQDMGRYGLMKYGVPISGAMDAFSFCAANTLVENDPNSACLEITLIGPELEALSKTQIAITGGDCSPEVNGKPVSMWQIITLKKSDCLSFRKMQSGCRAYISVKGGVDVPKILGSRSTYARGGFGGFDGRPLAKDDIIEMLPPKPFGNLFTLRRELIPCFSRELVIRVIMGPQADLFTEQGVDTFLSSPYTVTIESDRMGYRLEGPEVEHAGKSDIVSDALLPGAIQVPRNGKPIIIMKDAQTTGGYAKIAVVITPDIDLLGQARPNDKVRFTKVTLDVAQKQLAQYCRLMSNLKNMMIQT